MSAPSRAHDGSKMRFGGWTGIAIVISGAWIAGSAIGLRYADLRVAGFLRNSAFEICDYANHHLGNFGNCWRDLMKVAASADGRWVDIATVSLAPVLLGWLAIYITLKLRRWLLSSHR